LASALERTTKKTASSVPPKSTTVFSSHPIEQLVALFDPVPNTFNDILSSMMVKSSQKLSPTNVVVGKFTGIKSTIDCVNGRDCDVLKA